MIDPVNYIGLYVIPAPGNPSALAHGKEIMETIDSQAAQISELKEKLLLATAKVVAYDNVAATPEEAAECGCILGHPFESYPQRWQDYWTDKARQQLKADPDLQKAGVEWE